MCVCVCVCVCGSFSKQRDSFKNAEYIFFHKCKLCVIWDCLIAKVILIL